ncbi:MAG TPA: hypothetical protein VF176_09185 [Solirubrobacterales bacterium]
MKQIRKRLTYANVMSSIAVFLILGGATAIAAKKIGTKQIKANAVTAGKIKKNAVTTAKIKNNAVTGSKVNESTLGEVPLATNATTAANLTGQLPFFLRLNFGQSQTLATNGAVSLVAQCATGVGGTDDRARILGQTTQDGSILDGQNDLTGPTTFLDTGTAEDSRVLVSTQITSGKTFVNGSIDQGFVLAPDGKTISTNSEGLVIGVNYSGSNCIYGGVLNLLG